MKSMMIWSVGRFADIDVSRVQLSGESRRKRALITARRASPRAGCCGGRHGNDDGRTPDCAVRLWRLKSTARTRVVASGRVSCRAADIDAELRRRIVTIICRRCRRPRSAASDMRWQPVRLIINASVYRQRRRKECLTSLKFCFVGCTFTSDSGFQ